jgi:eukaryotic-like serine/threonine-protein kinase
LTGLHWIQADGSGRGGTIPGTSQQDAPGSVSPDGENLVYLHISPDTGGDIYVVPLRGTPTPRPLVKTSAYEGGPQFSSDGRWIAYVSNESGQFQVYVRPFPGPDRKVQVSTEGGSFPRWSRNGNELFYRNGNRMMAVQITRRSQDVDPVLSAPTLLFEAKYATVGTTLAGYDVSLDDQHFIFVREDATAGRLRVVLNWTEELKRLVPLR